jgi:hypothetical protein
VPADRAVLIRGVAEHEPPPRAVHHARVDQAAGDERGGQLAAVGQDVGQGPIAASTGAPSALAPNSITPGSIFRNPDTAGYRAGSTARQSSGSGPPGGGTLSVTSASAARSSARETTDSIACHTSETRGSAPGAPHPSDSNRASTATASLADALASRG